IMRALDVGNDPAVGSVHDHEFTTMKLSVTARPLLSKASKTSSVSTTFAIAGPALFAALLIVRLRTNYH
ncbi:MAG TPA: hypothetical protein VK678_08105, partial [Bradyrhizobium sp.]|nr:hypothetical protein [Bradyrhizobium sp.]